MALRRTKDTGRHAGTPSNGASANGASPNGASNAAHAVPAQAAPERPAHWSRLGEILVNRAQVSQKQVAEALLQQSASGKPLGQLLVQLGALGDRELAHALAEQMQLALVDLAQEQPDADAITKLSEGMARAETAVPMMVVDGTLVVAVAEPSAELLKQLAAATGMPVTMVVAPSGDIRRAIDASYRALTDIDTHVAAFQ